MLQHMCTVSQYSTTHTHTRFFCWSISLFCFYISHINVAAQLDMHEEEHVMYAHTVLLLHHWINFLVQTIFSYYSQRTNSAMNDGASSQQMVNQCFLHLASPALITQWADASWPFSWQCRQIGLTTLHVLELHPGYILITVWQEVLLASTMKVAAREGNFHTEVQHFDGGLAVSASDDFGKVRSPWMYNVAYRKIVVQ